jgi:hypothetical protein
LDFHLPWVRVLDFTYVLEDSVKKWYLDKSISSFPCLPSLLVNNIWWACNSTVFKDTLVPPEVTTSVTLSQASEFKVDPKEPKAKKPKDA